MPAATETRMKDDSKLPMTELLVAHGADVNALWGGSYAIILAPLEAFAPRNLKWLLDHGADPNARATFPQEAKFHDKAPTDALHGVTPVSYARQYPDRRYVNAPALAAIIERGGKE